MNKKRRGRRETPRAWIQNGAAEAAPLNLWRLEHPIAVLVHDGQVVVLEGEKAAVGTRKIV